VGSAPTHEDNRDSADALLLDGLRNAHERVPVLSVDLLLNLFELPGDGRGEAWV